MVWEVVNNMGWRNGMRRMQKRTYSRCIQRSRLKLYEILEPHGQKEYEKINLKKDRWKEKESMRVKGNSVDT